MQRGFLPIILIIIAGAVLVIGGGGFWYYQQSAAPSDKPALETQAVTEQPKQQAPTPPPKAAPKPTISPVPPPTLPVPVMLPITPPPPAPPAPLLINGKTLQERLAEAYDRLHTRGSGQHIRDSFPDIELVYTDKAEGMPFPSEILPFRYYYSREADTTFNICEISLSVFICKGKLDKLIKKIDIDSGRCEMTPIYGDPRL